MKRLIVLMSALAFLVALPHAALAQDHEGNSPKADLHLSRALVVGTTTVQAGDYRVQCLFVDGKHVLVMTSSDDGREVARVPCTEEQLSGKVQLSDFRSIVRPDGTEALTAVRIKGEKIAHRLVLD
jgi:hypothetical protein